MPRVPRKKSATRRPSTTPRNSTRPSTPRNSTRPSTSRNSTRPSTPRNSTRPSTPRNSTRPSTPRNSTRPSTNPELPTDYAYERPGTSSELPTDYAYARPGTSSDLRNNSPRPSTSSEASKSYLRSVITPTRQVEKKPWNSNPKVEPKARPAYTPKQASEKFQSLSEAAVSKLVKASTSTNSTSGETVKTSVEAVNPPGKTVNITGEAVKTTGETSKTTGETAKIASETANTSSEATANTTSETAKTTGETARTAGPSSKTPSQITKITGETAKITGEAVKTAIEIAKITGQIAKITGRTLKTKSQTGKTGGQTGKKTKAKTAVRKEQDKLTVTYIDGIPVVLVESGPNKGRLIPIPPIPSNRVRPGGPGPSSRPSTSSNSKPGIKTGQKSAPGPLVDPQCRPSLKCERFDGNPSVAGGSKEETPNPKQPKMTLRTNAAEAVHDEDTRKWEAFFNNQSVEALLSCCEFAGPADLVRIHNAIREKLGINDARPWAQISLPRNFVALLNNMTTRAHNEINDDSRTEIFRILLDMAERYEPDGLTTFHNDIGLVLCLDQRLHKYRDFDGVLPMPIQIEYRVVMQLKTWLYNTYGAMMDSGSWVPRTPRPMSSMLRTTFETQRALDNLFSLEKIFDPNEDSDEE